MSTLSLQYAPATREDIPIIFAQSRAIVDLYEDLEAIDYPRVMEWLQRKVEANIESYTCVWVDGQKAAFYRLILSETEAELDDFYVLSDFQGRGIGTEILKKCCVEAAGSIFLYVFSQNTRAISLYRRHGFAVTEQVSPSRLIMTRRA